MKNFIDFKLAVQKQFDKMTSGNITLFKTDVDKHTIWDTYLNSFRPEDNPVYKERTEHDCNSCKQFIRTIGSAVAIVDNKLVSIWDIEIGGGYQVVADALSKLVKSAKISNVFLHYEKKVGTDFNHQELEDGKIKKWNHFYCELPREYVVQKDKIDSKLGTYRSNKEVFERTLKELTLESAEVVLELIQQNSIYRGAEHKSLVELFIKHKHAFDKLSDKKKDFYVWQKSMEIGNGAKIRNTVIGTLLTDISEGVDLDKAVKAFETKVAPANYKRPTALITKKMIENAQQKVDELGLEPSLSRRHAVVEDITINNVLFADRNIKKAMNVFDDLPVTAAVNSKTFDKVQEITIDKFVNNIVPKADSIELLLENHHSGNLMSLIAPVHRDAKLLFKWNNNFSWSYNGEVTDSIKERVKAAGGNITGVMRASLSWYNYDDLDIHCIEPGGNEINFYSKRSITSGKLDVDMNAGGRRSREPVENIVWTNEDKMKHGMYTVFVHNYNFREKSDVGFEVEIEFGGQTHNFYYAKAVKHNEKVTVAKFKFDGKNIEFVESLPSTAASRELWGLQTNNFQKVSMMMLSPNHWDDQKIGNKHWFFILDGCKNELSARGFFNEFLNSELLEHRKVLEVLGSKMKVPVDDKQLSGLGFSSTQKNSIICKVRGKTTRTVKVNF